MSIGSDIFTLSVLITVASRLSFKKENFLKVVLKYMKAITIVKKATTTTNLNFITKSKIKINTQAFELKPVKTNIILTLLMGLIHLAILMAKKK